MATCYPADRGDGGPFDDGVSECFADVNKGFMYKMMVNNCYFWTYHLVIIHKMVNKCYFCTSHLAIVLKRDGGLF